MNRNKNLRKAMKQKKDEFYTRYEDVVKELDNYKDKFKDKIILCNCNDKGSAFEKYFKENKDIKELIITEGRFQDNLDELKRCDIVVTNPPFSQFREFIDLLVKYDKDFIIWGNNNACACKNVFPLIKNEKVFLGHLRNKTCTFDVPKEYHESGECKVPACSVFTTFDIVDTPLLELTATYDPEKYPKYDNYDAIEVSKVEDIPKNYDGLMGTSITFLSKWNKEQFEVVSASNDLNLRKNIDYSAYTAYYPNGEYNPNGRKSKTFGNSPVIEKNNGKSTYYRRESDGKIVQPVYFRIFIKLKK